MRRLVVGAVPIALALVALPALPAAAVVDTQTWTSPTHQWWTSGTWSSGEVPESGDTLIFPATSSTRSDANVGNIALAALQFTGDHLLGSAPPAGVLTLTGSTGLQVADDEGGAEVTINNDLATVGTQTWTVDAGSSLAIPAVVTVDAAGALTLDVEGVLTVSGNINGQFTGSVTKTGAGTMVRSGGAGGAVGGGGLDIQEGLLALDNVSHGTGYQVTGGRIGGDGVVDFLTLTDGVIEPYDYGVAPFGILVGANGVALNGGTYQVSVDGVGGQSSYLSAGSGTLSGSGTALELVAQSLLTIGDVFEVAGVQTGSIAADFRFQSPAGDVLEDGDQFVSAGLLWGIDYGDGVVSVTYLGLAPEAPEDPDTEPETLPDTGVAETTLGALVAAAAGILVGGVLLVTRRRRAS